MIDVRQNGMASPTPEDVDHLLAWLFDGYVLTYRSLNVFWSSTSTDATHRELEHFARIAHGLGFLCRMEKSREDTQRRMDLCWERPEWKLEKNGEKALTGGKRFLHLERETRRLKNRDTLEKLLGAQPSPGRPPYIVAILGHVTERERQSLQQLVRASLGDSRLLVIAWIGDTDREDTDFRSCEGWLFLPDKTLIRVAQAYRDAGTAWSLRCGDTSNWTALPG